MNIKPPFYLGKNFVEIGNIIGVVTSLDVVESKFTGKKLAHHSNFWVNGHYKNWRWNVHDGVNWFTVEHRPNVEQLQFIIDHLTKKFGIKFFENGYHDWEDLASRRKALAEQLKNEQGK